MHFDGGKCCLLYMVSKEREISISEGKKNLIKNLVFRLFFCVSGGKKIRWHLPQGWDGALAQLLSRKWNGKVGEENRN